MKLPFYMTYTFIAILQIAVLTLGFCLPVKAATLGYYFGVGGGYETIKYPEKPFIAASDKTPFTPTRTGIVQDENENHFTMGSLFAGYTFNKNFGIEARYSYLGLKEYGAKYIAVQEHFWPDPLPTLYYSSQSFIVQKLQSISIVGKAYLTLSNDLPAGNGIDVYGIFGAAIVNKKVAFSDGGITLNSNLAVKEGSYYKFAPVYGVGIALNATDHWTAAIEATRIQGMGNMSSNIRATPNVDSVTFNLIYNLG